MPQLGPCWLWTGAHREAWYGMLSRGGHSASAGMYGAHRLSWEMANGPVPPGLNVLHHCDTPLCVRPVHLFLGTHEDNVADRVAKKRSRGPSKLTREQVEEIKRLRTGGMMVKDVASRFGVVPSTIVHIMKGRSWADKS